MELWAFKVVKLDVCGSLHGFVISIAWIFRPRYSQKKFHDFVSNNDCPPTPLNGKLVSNQLC